MFKSSNPALRRDVFDSAHAISDPMTVQGTVNKTAILIAIMAISGGYVWNQVVAGDSAAALPLMYGGLIGAIIAAIIIIFKNTAAPFVAPIYAVCEGLALGGISAMYNAQTDGLALQAVGLTVATLVAMLTAYRTGLIKVTDRLRSVVICATCGIALFYVVALIASLFGAGMAMNFYNSSSPLSIGISLVVVGVAAFNLLLDFDLIERGATGNAPKYMEWYGAFALILTLVWLYLEMLRLLSKLNRR